MMDETRYTIYVSDECVQIEGKLTIREAFDMLSYFDQQGFTTIEENFDQSTLTFRKRDIEKEERQRIIEESISDNKFYKNLYEKSEKEIEELKIEIRQFDYLIKKNIEDTIEKSNEINRLKNENSKLKSRKKLEDAILSGELHVYEYEGNDENGRSTTGNENIC